MENAAWQPRPLSASEIAGDLVKPGHPLFGLVWINPERMSGAPCFYGTRVPIKSLFDHLSGGDTVDQFLDYFPGVQREQVVAVLELALAGIVNLGTAA